MATRVQEDFFTEDADETCPLCVEDLDLSDKNFRPCPCGYQVCQFCYHNIKNNVNGLCPACRRPYDDSSIEYKAVSAEEQRAEITNQARRKALARKKETEQKQTEVVNTTKSLAGRRVVQKNLVYVVGLSQQTNQEDFLKTLRGPQYFGQYGKIIKIVVSRAKLGSLDEKAVAIYVTFEKREDAARCIAAVNGSVNLNSQLRAQYGTTKYCSAYLRGEACGNRNCTFLHEVGEETDSFSRADVSSMNAMSSQRPTHSSAQTLELAPQAHGSPRQTAQSLNAAIQNLQPSAARLDAAGGAAAAENTDASALPSSASWGARGPQPDSGPHKMIEPLNPAPTSPQVSNAQTSAIPAMPGISGSLISTGPNTINSEDKSRKRIRSSRATSPYLLQEVVKVVANATFDVVYDRSLHSDEFMRIVDRFPQLFDRAGGRKRYLISKEMERERIQQEEERNVIGAISTAEEDENLGSGSLQLGGEPDHTHAAQDSRTRAPGISGFQHSSFGSPLTSSALNSKNSGPPPRSQGPSAHPMQHQLAGLSHAMDPRHNMPQVQQGPMTSLHQHQPSNPFQTTSSQAHSPLDNVQTSARQASRFTFSTDSNLSSTTNAVKPAANPRLSQQQAGVLPAAHGKAFPNHGPQLAGHNQSSYYSGIQGPPPGLKSTGTPPVSGGGMFGQGHGFTTGLPGLPSTTKNLQDELLPQSSAIGSDQRENTGISDDTSKRDIGSSTVTFDRLQPAAPVGTKVTAEQPSTRSPRKNEAFDTDIAEAERAALEMGTNKSAPGLSLANDFPSLPPAIKASLPGGIGDRAKTTQEKNRPVKVASKDAAVMPTGTGAKEIKKSNPSSSRNAKEPREVQDKTLKEDSRLPRASVPLEKNVQAKQSDASPHKEATNTPNAPRTPERKTRGSIIENKTPSETKRDPQTRDIRQPERAMGQVFRGNDALMPGQSISTQADKADAEKSSPSPRSSRNLAVTTPTRKNKDDTSGNPSLAPFSSPPPPLMGAANVPGRLASRRPSNSSIQVPDTPVSERISDNASVASTSRSRANSPPPSSAVSGSGAPSSGTSRIVGSASVRTVSKAQQKKERQLRAKQAEDSKVEEEGNQASRQGLNVGKAEDITIMQEPILGRKKKSKKTPAAGKLSDTADSTPAATRSNSPSSGRNQDEGHRVLKERDGSIPPVPALRSATIAEAKSQSRNPDVALSVELSHDAIDRPQRDREGENGRVSLQNEGDLKSEAVSEAEPEPGAESVAEKELKNCSPAALISQLTASGHLNANVIAELLRAFSNVNARNDTDHDLFALGDPPLSTAQRARVNAWESFVAPDHHGRYCVIMAGGALFRGFTQAQADRFLELCSSHGLPPFPAALAPLLPQLTLMEPPVLGGSVHPSSNISSREAKNKIAPGTGASTGESSELLSTSPGHRRSSYVVEGDNIDSVDPATTPLFNRFASPAINDPYLLKSTNAVAPVLPSTGFVSANPLTGTFPSGTTPIVTAAGGINLDEAESRLLSSRRETEILEKKLGAILKRNRRLLLSAVH